MVTWNEIRMKFLLEAQAEKHSPYSLTGLVIWAVVRRKLSLLYASCCVSLYGTPVVVKHNM
jgi:hypothetical protein